MQKVLLVITVILLAVSSRAQFSKGTLQATGLTCAMCSNAINKALQTVPSVASVRSDIRNSAFLIVFKTGADVDIDALRKAVEDAGFGIGSLKLTGSFNQLTVDKDAHVPVGKSQFHFLVNSQQVLNGEQTLTVVDRDFVTAKQFKKISSDSKMTCLQTGKTAACCVKEGIADGTRIYHVTL